MHFAIRFKRRASADIDLLFDFVKQRSGTASATACSKAAGLVVGREVVCM